MIQLRNIQQHPLYGFVITLADGPGDRAKVAEVTLSERTTGPAFKQHEGAARELIRVILEGVNELTAPPPPPPVDVTAETPAEGVESAEPAPKKRRGAA